MKILQKLWDWLFRQICYGFSEKEAKEVDESRLIDDYSKRLDSFRAAAQAVIADHYRCKMLLESERVKLEEAKTAESANPDSIIAHNRFIMSQERVEYLHKQVISSEIEANRALGELEKLANDLSIVTMKLHDAHMAKRAADLRLVSENWRMESELGLNKELNALNRIEQDAKHAQRKAELTVQTNEVLSEQPVDRKQEE